MANRIVTTLQLECDLARYSLFAWGCYLAMKFGPADDRELVHFLWGRLDDEAREKITAIRQHEGAG
jgi:hypothetical protein